MASRIYFKKFISQGDFKYYSTLVFNEKIMLMNYGRVFTLEEAIKTYKRVLDNNEIHKDFGSFKVFEKSTNNFMGLGGLEINEDLTEAELEYLLLPEYWGKGYGSEIAKKLLAVAKETKSIKEVTAIIEPKNIASKKILLNNGFKSQKIFEIEDNSLAEMFSKKYGQVGY